jgi:hypothetical protein
MRPSLPLALLTLAGLFVAPTLPAQEPANLLANGAFEQGLEGWWVSQGETCTTALVAVAVGGAKQALRVTLTPKPGGNPWDASLGCKLGAPLQKNDVVRVQLWLRSPQSCRASVLLQVPHAPWTTLFARTVTAVPEWRQFTVQGRCAQDYPAEEAGLSLQLGHDTGEIEIAQIRITDLGPQAADEAPTAPANPLGLIPFVLPWDDATPGVTDVSAWLAKPAGGRGFVAARAGRLYTGEARLRLLGTNICTSACFPEHADAEKVAARLAKFGINCVRFHHMDAPWTSDNIFAPDKLALAPAQLERLDYFVAQLKAHGIYTNLNLHVSRIYPGFPTWEGMPDFCKGVDLFYPPMVQMQRDYARELLTHANPYTKTRYVDEPALALVEINNENGLLSQWSWGALDGMLPVYRDELQRQWNAWLQGLYPDHQALLKAWDLVARPLGAEMLANGAFDRALEGWVLEQNGTAKASASVAADGPGGKPAVTLRIEAIDDQGWHVQFLYPGLGFAKDGVYTLEFDARADSARTLSLDARQAHAPWGTLWSFDLKLTPEWQHVRLPVSITNADDNGRISFGNLGAKIGTVQLAGVSLRPGGGYTLPPDVALGSIGILTKAEFSGVPGTMQRDWLRFLWDTEAAYWTGMARYLREDLGVKCPIVGTAAGFSPIGIQAALEVVDIHAYWKHPHFPGRPWDADNWVLPNLPMAGVAGGGTLAELALSRVSGKPFLVTEYNHPAPNTHNSEAFLLAAAYAGLQDWDGFFSFAYAGSRAEWSAQRILGYFDVEHHPTQMATMPAAAALFLRGDLAAPAQRETVSTTVAALADLARTAGSWANGGNLGLSRAAALQHPVALRLDGGVAEKAPELPPAGDRLGSADGQWRWDSTPGQERVLIDTPRSKALIGSTLGGPFRLGDVTLAPGKNLQDWAAITLTAMDGADFAAPGRILVTATGYAENTAMGWKNEAKSTVGRDWGVAPTLIEGIPVTVALSVPAARLSVWALDERGQRREPLTIRDTEGKATFDLGPACRTLWYEAEIK